MARSVLLLVPVLYLGCVLLLQPADRLGPAESAPRGSLFLYDDYDVAAMALRGLNARLGRPAGRLDAPPKLPGEEFSRQLTDTEAVPHARSFLEYPHVMLGLFRLGFVGVPEEELKSVPAAVLDGCHNNLVEHTPENLQQQQFWARLRGATRVYRVVMAFALILLLGLLAVGYEGTRLAPPKVPLWLLVLPGALFFALHRFDVLPALLTAGSFLCLARRRPFAAGLCLGGATLVKVYPILLAPLVIRYLLDKRGSVLAWSTGFALAAALVLLPVTVLLGWESVLAPYRFQLTRPPEFKWTLYGYVLPRFLGQSDGLGSAFRLGSVLAVLGILLAHRPRDLVDLLRRGTTVLLVFVAVQNFYSPQWILWLAPLCLPQAAHQRQLIPLWIALDLVSYLSVVSVLPGTPLWPLLRTALILGRGAVLAGLAWVLWHPDSLRAEIQPEPIPTVPCPNPLGLDHPPGVGSASTCLPH